HYTRGLKGYYRECEHQGARVCRPGRESILKPPADSRHERDDRTEMETEGRTTHGLQLQLGMPLLLRRTSHLRQMRDGPCLPHREGELRRGRARRIEIHPRRGVAEGDPPGT